MAAGAAAVTVAAATPATLVATDSPQFNPPNAELTRALADYELGMARCTAAADAAAKLQHTAVRPTSAGVRGGAIPPTPSGPSLHEFRI